MRQLHISQSRVRFILGVDQSLMADYRTFEFVPHVLFHEERCRPIAMLRPPWRTEVSVVIGRRRISDGHHPRTQMNDRRESSFEKFAQQRLLSASIAS